MAERHGFPARARKEVYEAAKKEFKACSQKLPGAGESAT